MVANLRSDGLRHARSHRRQDLWVGPDSASCDISVPFGFSRVRRPGGARRPCAATRTVVQAPSHPYARTLPLGQGQALAPIFLPPVAFSAPLQVSGQNPYDLETSRPPRRPRPTEVFRLPEEYGAGSRRLSDAIDGGHLGLRRVRADLSVRLWRRVRKLQRRPARLGPPTSRQSEQRTELLLRRKSATAPLSILGSFCRCEHESRLLPRRPGRQPICSLLDALRQGATGTIMCHPTWI